MIPRASMGSASECSPLRVTVGGDVRDELLAYRTARYAAFVVDDAQAKPDAENDDGGDVSSSARSSARSSASWLRGALPLFLIAFVSYAYFYQGGGWNVNSRLDLVRAIVEEGGIRIDSFHLNTGDKSMRDGHFYCDKAPGLSWLAVPVYGLIAATVPMATGQPDLAVLTVASYLNAVWAVALPAALSGVVLFWLLGLWGLDALDRGLITVAYTLGTFTFPYSTLFLPVVVHGTALLLAFALLVSARDAPLPRRTLLLMGLACGAAVVLDYTAAFGVVIMGLAVVARSWRDSGGLRSWPSWLWFAAGGVLPALALFGYHTAAFGGPFMTGYHFSTWPEINPTAVAAGDPTFASLRKASVSPAVIGELLWGSSSGLFNGNPWLWLTLPGAAALVQSGRRLEAAICGAVVVTYVLMNSSLFDWQGGWIIGPRYLVPVLPFAALLAAGVLCPRFTAHRPRLHRWLRLGVAALTLVSIVRMLAVAAVGAKPPPQTANPIGDIVMPAFFSGYLGLNAAHVGSPYPVPGKRFAWNLGEFMGLTGTATLIPLCALWLVLGAWYWRTTRAANQLDND